MSGSPARWRAGSDRSARAASTEADRDAHRAFVATLGEKPIWTDIWRVYLRGR